MKNQEAHFPADQAYIAHLRPLADAGVFALVEGLVGLRPEADLIDFAARAEGDPQMITDLVLGLLAENQVDTSGTTARLRSTVLPERLIATVRQRLGILTPTGRQLVTVAAVLTQVVALDDVAEMLDDTPAGLLPGLEEATHGGLLVVRGESMTFASELLWLTVRRSISLPVANALREQADQLRDGAPPRPLPPKLVPPLSIDVDVDEDRSLELNAPEWDIVRLVRQGKTNLQIASNLNISRHTVSYHLRKIYRRHDVVSRAELVGLVQEHHSA